MSDTLQEQEDQIMEEEANEREIRRIRRARLGKSKTEFDMTLNEFAEKFDGGHQVTKSGTCVIPGCPCRGWSAQETAGVKEVSDQPLAPAPDISSLLDQLREQWLEVVKERDELRKVVQELLNRFYPHQRDSGPSCAKCKALLRGTAVLNGKKGVGE